MRLKESGFTRKDALPQTVYAIILKLRSEVKRAKLAVMHVIFGYAGDLFASLINVLFMFPALHKA